jgi:hypothetical protein
MAQEISPQRKIVKKLPFLFASFGLLTGTVGGGVATGFFINNMFINCNITFIDPTTKKEKTELSMIGDEIELILYKNIDVIKNGVEYKFKDDPKQADFGSNYVGINGKNIIVMKAIPNSMSNVTVYAFIDNKEVAHNIVSISPYQEYKLTTFNPSTKAMQGFISPRINSSIGVQCSLNGNPFRDSNTKIDINATTAARAFIVFDDEN